MERLEAYTLAKREVLLVKAVVAGEEDEVLIFKVGRQMPLRGGPREGAFSRVG